MPEPKPGIYTHFKGGRYELIAVAAHSETREPMAVYRALYGEHGLWVRPLAMWDEVVERDGRRYRRFAPEGQGNELPEIDAAPETAPPGADAVLDTLARVFGYRALRDGQRPLIDALLKGRDALGIMPTGAGKSICYQLPALLMDGTALVISPLISLMKDQVAQLTQNGVPAAYLNSTLTPRQFDLALSRAEQGAYRVLYVAPERLLTERFLGAARRMRITLVAVDEAHCISQWGQDFRPSYLTIPDFIARLPARPPVAAFTATATERVRRDIALKLCLREPRIVVTGFDRPNLFFEVLTVKRKPRVLMALMARYPGASGIVYCATRKAVDDVYQLLIDNGLSAARYHAGLPDDERRQSQDDFQFDRAQIIVATNAFGMGIDKSNVRFVIHYNMPKDLESYYQEAGRAGRDGGPADCVLLYGRQDIITQRQLIELSAEASNLPPDQAAQVRGANLARLNRMIGYSESTDCLRRQILAYFGADAPERCGHCSACAPRAPLNVTEPARTRKASAAKPPKASAAKPTRAKQQRVAPEDGDTLLFEQLRALRLRLAATRKVPSYVIFNDATLSALSAMRPTTRDELLMVPGIGQFKLDAYGDEFLAVIRQAQDGAPEYDP